MKKILMLIILSTQMVNIKAQNTHACCSSPSATTAFASFSGNANFRSEHESPLPSNYLAMGRMITFPTPDGKTGRAYYIPSKKQTKNFIFVFQEWWGLNDWIKKQADLYADSIPNVNVIAMDLYDGKITTNADEAGKLMGACDEARIKAIIKGALDYAGEDASIATVGWCFGGGWSLQGALMAGKRTKGCVMYYGMPESSVDRLKELNSDVLFVFAKKDQWINTGVKDQFVKNMQAAGKKITVKEYDADHAFANPSNAIYSNADAADAQKITLKYLRKVFGG